MYSCCKCGGAKASTVSSKDRAGGPAVADCKTTSHVELCPEATAIEERFRLTVIPILLNPRFFKGAIPREKNWMTCVRRFNSAIIIKKKEVRG